MSLNIFGLTISYYSLCILTGIILGYFLVSRKSIKYDIKSDDIDNLALITIPLAIIGARIYHIIAEWYYYQNHLDEVLSLQMRGLGIWGAIIVGIIVFVIYSKLRKVSLLNLLDLAVYGLLVGQIFGRFGNFFNKELYGYPTNLPWGIFIPIENRIAEFKNYEYFHPTFFYESLWNLIGLIILLILDKRKKLNRGFNFKFYLIWYSLVRIWNGFIRIESNDLGILNDSQIIAIIIILIVIGWELINIWIKKNCEKKVDNL